MAAGVRAGLTAAEGRRFGLTVGGAFLVLAAITGWRGHVTAMTVLGALAALLLVAGLLIPTRLGPVHRAWMGLALAISKVTSPIFLGVVFFVVITPLGLLVRVFRGNPLAHRAGESGFWVDRRTARAGRGTMTNQF